MHWQAPGGSNNLCDLVAVINGEDDSLLPPGYRKGVMHMKHLLRFKTVSTHLIHDKLCSSMVTSQQYKIRLFSNVRESFPLKMERL